MDPSHPTSNSVYLPNRKLSEGSQKPVKKAFFRSVSPSPLGVNKLPLSERHSVQFQQVYKSEPTVTKIASPRTEPWLIQKMKKKIKTFLSEKMQDPLPAPLFSVLAQSYYHQYEPLCPYGYVLVAALYKMHLIEPCLLAIEHITQKASPFTQTFSINLLHLGLQIIKQCSLEKMLSNVRLSAAIEHIFSVAQELQNEDLLDALQKAKDAKESNKSSLAYAQEGRQLLSRSIHDPSDRKLFESYEPQNSDPFYEQKWFLFSIQAFLVDHPFRLRLNPLQKERLLELALSLLTSPDAINLLLTDSAVQKISKQIIEKDFFEYSVPESLGHVELIETILSLPFISLQNLELLTMWTQKTFLDKNSLMDLLAGSRQSDPQGNLGRFAMLRLMSLAKEHPLDGPLCLQLLRFIYCYRAVPANQELLIDPLFESDWKSCQAAIAQHRQLAKLRGYAEKEFFNKEEIYATNFFIKKPSRSFASSMSSSEKSDIFEEFPKISSKAHPLWESESITEILKDSIIYYLLQGQEVSIKELLLYPKIHSPSIDTKILHFNQIVEFLVGEFLAKDRSLKNIQKMVKILCQVEELLLQSAAFEPAMAIYAFFHQASISRLEGAFFDKEKLFFSLFKDPNACCSEKNNFQKIKTLQERNPHSLELFSIYLKTLTQLKENSPEFTEEGGINIHGLELFGKLFNQFALKQKQALRYWSLAFLNPDFSLIEAFSTQRGQLEENELQKQWWERSQQIHRLRSFLYWGEDVSESDLQKETNSSRSAAHSDRFFFRTKTFSRSTIFMDSPPRMEENKQ